MEFAIKSLISDRQLIFSNLQKDASGAYYIDVELRGGRVSARTTIYIHNDAEGINATFQELGQLDKPWGGVETYVTVDRDFSLGISCNKLGHVCFEIKMRFEEGQPEEAYISAHLMTDLSAMPSIAEEAQKFFAERSPPASGA